MASESTLQRLQAEFDSSPDCIETIVILLEAGATPDFICRYRRDEVDDAEEERVLAVEERLHFLADLEARKHSILEQAEQRGQADDALRETLARCHDQDQLDDIYQSFRPRRRTHGVQAREKGLGEMADALRQGQLPEQPLTDWADSKVDAEQGLSSREEVLEGLLHCLAEDLGADPETRARFRRELQNGIVRTKAVEDAEKRKGANRYKEFFEFEKQVRRIPASQMLSLRHAERDGLVTVRIDLEDGKPTAMLSKLCKLDLEQISDPTLKGFIELAFKHCYEQLIHPGCERDVRARMKERADREAVRSLARNLRSQLMAPPLGAKPTVGLRASRKTAWLALVAGDGSVQKHLTLDLEGDEKRNAAIEQFTELLKTDAPAGVALPHGRHQDVSYEFLSGALQKLEADQRRNLLVVPVDEAASAIHATSAQSRKEMPTLDVGVRTAVSLARRLQDPLQELLGLDPKALGLGQNLEEVHQGILNRHLDSVIGSCVAKIGVDLNNCKVDQLARVPGANREMARKILDDRQKNGAFTNLAQVQERCGLNDLEHQQIAGFVRIHGDEPLDATGVHPENYEMARAVAGYLSVAPNEVIGHGQLRSIRSGDLSSVLGEEEARSLRLRDLLRTLAQAGKDPRGELRAVGNEVQTLTDLSPDQELRGRVTNLTEFGAFVDLGIGQDGLVHISQIPGNRLRDPERMLAVGEVINVYVLKVDTESKRISLSMHKPRHLAEGRRPTLGERMERGGQRRRRPDQEPQVQSRAARAPEGRRRSGPGGGGPGGNRRRSGPGEGRPRRPRDDSREQGGYDQRERSGGYDRGGSRGGRRGEPKVFTVESGMAAQDSLGHKGELRSLSGLASLLGAAEQASSEPPQTPPQNPPQSQPAPQEQPRHDATPAQQIPQPEPTQPEAQPEAARQEAPQPEAAVQVPSGSDNEGDATKRTDGDESGSAEASQS